MERSSRKSSDERSFIGFYTDPELKDHAARQADEEGVSLSEWMRQQLKETTRRDQVAAA